LIYGFTFGITSLQSKLYLLLEIFQFTKNFQKEFKYTVGESIKKDTVELLTLIFRANSRQDKEQVLQEAREHIEVIRLFIRLMKYLNFATIGIKNNLHAGNT